MRVQNAAVIGHPIGHTMSPFIHQRLFALEGIPVSYQVTCPPPCPPCGSWTASTSPSPTKAPFCPF